MNFSSGVGASLIGLGQISYFFFLVQRCIWNLVGTKCCKPSAKVGQFGQIPYRLILPKQLNSKLIVISSRESHRRFLTEINLMIDRPLYDYSIWSTSNYGLALFNYKVDNALCHLDVSSASQWGDWGTWSACVISDIPSVRTRERQCRPGIPNFGITCPGSSTEEESCPVSK